MFADKNKIYILLHACREKEGSVENYQPQRSHRRRKITAERIDFLRLDSATRNTHTHRHTHTDIDLNMEDVYFCSH